MSQIYFIGNNSSNKLGDKRKQSFNTPTLLQLNNELNVVECCGAENLSCFRTEEGDVYHTSSSVTIPKKYDIKEPIVSLKSGCYHILCLGESGKVYAWGTYNNYGQCGNGSTTTVSTPAVVTALTDKGITEIHPGGWNSLFFNKEEGKLYGCGINSNGENGYSQSSSNLLTPVLVQENVARVFPGMAEHGFVERRDGEIYGFGWNTNNQVGITSGGSIKTPQKINELSGLNIKTITLGCYHSIALTEEGDIYGTGENSRTAFGTNLKKFTKYTNVNNTKFVAINSGYEYSVAISDQNEIYIFGLWPLQKATQPKKLDTPLEISCNKVVCTYNSGCWFMSGSNEMQNDMIEFYESGFLSDATITNIPVHKRLLEIRLKKDFEIINNILSNFTEEENKVFFQYLYSDKIQQKNTILVLLRSFGFKDTKELNFKKDLRELMDDDDSKDFNILVKIDEDEEEGEEDEYEEIPVHKFILAARSGLFRDMFKDIKENQDSVKDFSGKSIDTIELLVGYFYTNLFDVTADHDPELIKDELEDIAEYYKLSTKKNLVKLFDKCAK
ncbi:rcc1 and btb domain containing protein [Anaeramoeba flamelloides]|uniref:Rcc1 and btb domain containing protein n=1 Tax=Anaeramoeba flamelloides TaxID=1746091 RepID=A0ABQ8Z0L4_9EUKA|nr:rcc1 and btb domain containing protein [Anaeramoeba flamelloides]